MFSSYLAFSLSGIVVALYISRQLQTLQEVLWAASQELIKYVKISLSWLLLDHSGLREGGREGGRGRGEGGRGGGREGGRERGRKERGREGERAGGGRKEGGEEEMRGLSEAVRSEEYAKPPTTPLTFSSK